MGAEDYFPKKKPHYDPNKRYKIKMLLLVILTNLLTVFIFAGPSAFKLHPISKYTQHLSLPLWEPPTALLRELNATHLELTRSRSEIEELTAQLKFTNLIVKALATDLPHLQNSISTSQTMNNNKSTILDHINGLPREIKLAIGPHKLPLGFSPRSGSDELFPPVGGACLKYKEELSQYMTYTVGGVCPADDVFAQQLMLKGCEPLPRRRCHPKAPTKYVEPRPSPGSLWATPPDTSIVWDPYTCKNYKCLIDRKNEAAFYDCKDCFDLKGREKARWLFDKGLDYGIDNVLTAKPRGTIRIGLDIGGGSGTWAARMKERNVTIITTSMNLDGPFNSFISSRGLLSMHLTISQRLPFFENTLDIVHSMHVLSNWIPDMVLEFTLYDVYRVLRPGGLFWLDHFFCLGHQLNTTYVPMLNRAGFKRLRWNAGMKLDRGAEKNEWYFSALLEKPMS